VLTIAVALPTIPLGLVMLETLTHGARVRLPASASRKMPELVASVMSIVVRSSSASSSASRWRNSRMPGPPREPGTQTVEVMTR
jgi:hypothetical protein